MLAAAPPPPAEPSLIERALGMPAGDLVRKLDGIELLLYVAAGAAAGAAVASIITGGRCARGR